MLLPLTRLKGAFAACYEMTTLKDHGQLFAAKLISKESLTKPVAKQKVGLQFCAPLRSNVCQLAGEISNHMSLTHPHIVRCYNYFEDSEYFYLILEHCNNKVR